MSTVSLTPTTAKSLIRTIPEQMVSFGTSGHRGSSLAGSFNEAHILTITRPSASGASARAALAHSSSARDTHALSRPAERTALEVLAAKSRGHVVQADDGFTPTPSISRLILTHNRAARAGWETASWSLPRTTACRRRLQVQPTQWRPGRHQRHRLDPRPGQCASARKRPGDPPHALRASAHRAHRREDDFVGP